MHLAKLRISRYLLLLSFLLAILPGLVSPAGAQTIKLGQVNLSFYAVTGGVVQEVLEASGVKVELTTGTHPEIYPKLGTGEIDILAASWLPSAHAALYAQVKDRTFVLARLYGNARLYWAVPAYVAEGVRDLSDLARPEFAGKFDQSIVGVGPGSGLMLGAEKAMDAYGLRAAGYQLRTAPAAEWIGRFREAVAARKWTVMPLWQPHWLNAVYELRVLTDSKGVYGGEDEAVLLAMNSLREKVSPEVLARLQAIRLSVAAVTEMDRLVNLDGLTPRAAAQRWIKANPAETSAWFPPVKSGAGR